VINLFLLRHGETEHSRQDRFCGRLDVPLTAEGHRMARAFAAAYADRRWRGIYTSTRRRTIETVAPLAGLIGMRTTADARLDEIDYGDWQGLDKHQIAGRDPERFRRWCDDPCVGAPGGESAGDVVARVRDLLAGIASAHAGGGDVLVASHKTVLRLLVCDLVGIDLRRYRSAVAQPVGGLTIVELRAEGPMLRLLGDTRHLDAAEPNAARRADAEAPQPAPLAAA